MSNCKNIANFAKQEDVTVVKSLQDFLAWVNKLEGTLLLYRGLSKACWGVSASGYRCLTKESDKSTAEIFLTNIEKLLDDTRLRGFGHHQSREISDLELLANLQHEGAATCLIDFSASALVGLWFACREDACVDKCGKVVALNTDETSTFTGVTHAEMSQESIGYFLHGDKLWKWQPTHHLNRILAQHSIFVFGRGEIDMEQPYCKVAIIPPENKRSILNELEKVGGINESYLFSDFAGFAARNSTYVKTLNATTKDGTDKKDGSISDSDIKPPEKDLLGAKKLDNKNIADKGTQHEDASDNKVAAEQFLASALRYHQQGNFERAIDYYNMGIATDPNNAVIYSNLGLAKSELGNYADAIADYGVAIKINPRSTTAYNKRGVAKSKLGQHQEAIADYDLAIDNDSRSAEAYNNRGLAKSDLGDYEGAIADYSEAIDINPTLAEAYNNRGNVKGMLDDEGGAIADYKKAISINPQYAESHYNLGIAQRNLGEYADAIANFNKVLEINPQDAGTYNQRGITKGEQQDFAAAIADFDEAIKIGFVSAYYNRGFAKGGLGDFQGAVADFDEVIKLHPKFAAAYYRRGFAKYLLGDYPGAIADFDAAISITPNVQAYYRRGLAKSILEKYSDAITDFSKVIEIDPEHAAAYYNRGVAKHQLGDDHGSQQDFQRAKDLGVDSPIPDPKLESDGS